MLHRSLGMFQPAFHMKVLGRITRFAFLRFNENLWSSSSDSFNSLQREQKNLLVLLESCGIIVRPQHLDTK